MFILIFKKLSHTEKRKTYKYKQESKKVPHKLEKHRYSVKNNQCNIALGVKFSKSFKYNLMYLLLISAM